MNKVEESLLELKKKLFAYKEIFAVILYGSVARGDYSIRHSDIDIFVLIENGKSKDKINKTIDKLSLKYRARFHPEYQTLDIKEEDHTLLWKMFEEGKVLFSRGIFFIDKKKLGLDAIRLYRFDTSSIDKVKRVMFSRALHGRKNQTGLIDGILVIDSGQGGLLVKKNMFKEVEQMFDRFKIKYKVTKTVYG